jgi:hypothetical protein
MGLYRRKGTKVWTMDFKFNGQFNGQRVNCCSLFFIIMRFERGLANARGQPSSRLRRYCRAGFSTRK